MSSADRASCGDWLGGESDPEIQINFQMNINSIQFNSIVINRNFMENNSYILKIQINFNQSEFNEQINKSTKINGAAKDVIKLKCNSISW